MPRLHGRGKCFFRGSLWPLENRCFKSGMTWKCATTKSVLQCWKQPKVAWCEVRWVRSMRNNFKVDARTNTHQCYKSILHFWVTYALHCHYKVCCKLLWNCFRWYFKYDRLFLDISCTLSFTHVCYMVNKLNPACILFQFTVCYSMVSAVYGPKLLTYISAFRFLQ